MFRLLQSLREQLLSGYESGYLRRPTFLICILLYRRPDRRRQCPASAVDASAEGPAEFHHSRQLLSYERAPIAVSADDVVSTR